jgi:acetylornithine deacetylase
MRQRLFDAIGEREGELIELIQRLVRERSVLGNEASVQAIVADYLRGSGLEPDVWDLDAEQLRSLPGSGDSGVPFEGRPNVAAVVEGEGGGRSLILNGHVDVVSPEPVDLWTRDPWAAAIEGRRMYGRGAYDMKSGVAIILFLTRLLRDLGIRLKGDLTVESVIEEECTGNGSLAACYRDESRYRADGVIIMESTNRTYTMAHVGVMWFRITVKGRTEHAAYAHRGVNAIYRMIPILQELEALDADLNREQPHPTFAGIDHPINLNVGVIHGGDWPSTVPGECVVECRLSFYPGQTVDETRARVEAAIERATERDAWLSENPPAITYYGFQSAGSVISPDEDLVRVLARHHQAEYGQELVGRAGTGTDDMRNFIVYSNMPALCYGASGAHAHGADEWLDLDSLAPTARVVGSFILDWCGLAD